MDINIQKTIQYEKYLSCIVLTCDQRPHKRRKEIHRRQYCSLISRSDGHHRKGGRFACCENRPGRKMHSASATVRRLRTEMEKQPEKLSDCCDKAEFSVRAGRMRLFRSVLVSYLFLYQSLGFVMYGFSFDCILSV